MGPALFCRTSVNHTEWAQRYRRNMLLVLLDRPTPAAVDIVNIIEWAQHCFVKVLSIILDGPIVPAGTCY
jgi:hypothetical protein